LKGLLTLNPKERLTATSALRLPWFTAAVDAPTLEIGGIASSTFVPVLTSALAFLRRRALELVKLPRRCSGIMRDKCIV
jgi:cell division cycle 2-like protein